MTDDKDVFNKDEADSNTMLEQLAQADYAGATTSHNIQVQIANTRQKLHDALEQIYENNQLSLESDNTSPFGPIIPAEFANARFEVAMNNCRDKVSNGLKELERLETGINDFTLLKCGEKGVRSEEVVEAAICVIKGLEWGAPRFSERLEQIKISQSQIQTTATICREFCSVLVWIQAELVQILGDIESLQKQEHKEFDAHLNTMEEELINGLESIARLRETILMVAVGDQELSARAENPFQYAAEVLKVSVHEILNRVKESEATVDAIEASVKFLTPLLKDENKTFNQQQKDLGLGLLKDAKIKLPVFASNLKVIDEFQTHISVSSTIFVRGLSVLQGIQSNLHQLGA